MSTLKSRRKVISCAVVAVLLAGAMALWFGQKRVSARVTSTSENAARSGTQKPEIVDAGDLNEVTLKHPEEYPVAEVTTRVDEGHLQVNGVISPDVSRSVPVLSLTAGRVVETHARLGDAVQRGQTLLRIHSPDLAAAFADLEKNQADLVLAKQQLDRAQQLYERGALAQKELQAAVDAEIKGEVDVKTSAERIRIMGADPESPSPFIDIKAPASGVITEQNITAGTAVRSTDNSPNLFTIADLSHVWVLCDVYENDLALVRNGIAADIRVNAYPNRVFHGRVSNVSPLLDANTRAARVRIELANPEGSLRPNMFVTATFSLGRDQYTSVIPAKSVMRLRDKSWVFVAEGNGRFRRTEVHLRAPTPDGLQQVSGVPAGAMVIADALRFSSALDLATDEGNVPSGAAR